MMIEVFKTDVKQKRQAKMLLNVLMQHFPFAKANFDLDDCDRILRVEGNDFCKIRVAELLNTNGYQCMVIE